MTQTTTTNIKLAMHRAYNVRVDDVIDDLKQARKNELAHVKKLHPETEHTAVYDSEGLIIGWQTKPFNTGDNYAPDTTRDAGL